MAEAYLKDEKKITSMCSSFKWWIWS
jgi:hypothetical protein